jgi:hypothetical protein
MANEDNFSLEGRKVVSDMNSNITFNELYSHLTTTDSEDYSTVNFFKSLKFRVNGYRLVTALSNVEDFEVVKGFRYDDESEAINSFRSCQIKLNDSSKIDDVVNTLSKLPHVENVSALGEDITFTIQNGEGN